MANLIPVEYRDDITSLNSKLDQATTLAGWSSFEEAYESWASTWSATQTAFNAFTLPTDSAELDDFLKAAMGASIDNGKGMLEVLEEGKFFEEKEQKEFVAALSQHASIQGMALETSAMANTTGAAETGTSVKTSMAAETSAAAEEETGKATAKDEDNCSL